MSIKATAYVLLAAAVFAPEVARGQGGEDDCVFCSRAWRTEDQEELGHVAWDQSHWAQANSRGDGTHRSWWPGTCDERHPQCGRARTGGQGLASSEAAAERIWEAVRRGDGSKAVELALAQPEGSPIYVAWGRAAIQMRGCGDRVTMHISLSRLLTAEQVAELSRSAGQDLAGGAGRGGDLAEEGAGGPAMR